MAAKQKETQKKLVEKYLEEHKLEATLNEILNNCVKERPADPFVYLATMFKECSSTTAGIISVTGREVYDNRGVATIAVDVITGQGTFTASVPVAETDEDPEGRGMLELRDKDGRVQNAIRNINNIISKALINMNPTDQEAIDLALVDLDGSDRLTKMGSNALLAVSTACCRAGAAEKAVPLYKHIADLSCFDGVNLPVPFFNMISGGKRAPKSLSNLNFQEIMAIPVHAKSFREAMIAGIKLYASLGEVLMEKYPSFKLTDINEQGAYCPPIDNSEDAVQALCDAFEKAELGSVFKIAIDVAATSMVHPPEEGDDEEDVGIRYNLMWNNPDADPHILDAEGLNEHYNNLFESFPEAIVSLEDPFAANDFDGFSKFTLRYGESMQVMGDELICSNSDMILKCVESQACNSMSIKLDQVATVSDAIRAAKAAKEEGWGVCFSHRSGETEDTFIADLVAGTCAGQFKCGAPLRGERMAKFNRLLVIEEQCQDKRIDVTYVGISYRLPPS